MKPSAAAVWEAFCLDSEFARSTPADNPHFEAMRPFIEGSVTALDGYFDTFVSVASICVAKQKFLRHCMALNIGGVMAELMGTDEGLINEMLTDLADQLDEMVEDIPGYLHQHGLTEEQVMLGPQIGLNGVNLQKWRAGTLTIGKLLVSQPAVLLEND